jgi:Response regulator containing a CheY-like receiver domain and an HTH DNA-binding domain
MKTLTKREHEVAEKISNGFSEKMIADKLCIAHGTVRKHKNNIQQKLGAFNDKDVVRIYVLSNLEKFVFLFFITLQIQMSVSVTDLNVRVFRSVRSGKNYKNIRYEC